MGDGVFSRLGFAGCFAKQLEEILTGAGFTSARKLAFSFESELEAGEFLEALDCPTVQIEAWAHELWSWKFSYQTRLEGESQVIANLDFRSRHSVMENARKKRRATGIATTLPLSYFEVVVKRTAWKSRRAKMIRDCDKDDKEARLNIEKGERSKWLQIRIGILVELHMPVVAVAALATDPGRALLHVAGVARAKTIRTRCRMWQRVQAWLQRVFGVSWPAHVGQLLDLIEDFATCGCARTVPGSIAAALSFIEVSGGMADEDRYSTAPLWRKAVADLESNIKSKVGCFVRKAQLFSVTLVMSLELYVCSARPSYKRLLAWTRLVKVFACLRFDDTRGIPPARLRLTAGGLRGILTQTKTTGHNP